MSTSSRTEGTKRLRKGALIGAGLILAISTFGQAAEPEGKTPAAKSGDAVSGREIFLREWLPNDSRSHGGDGLGPVFNDSSCVACHNQGGAGGGGAASKNVNIVSATFNQPIHQMQVRRPSVGTQLLRSILGLNPQPNPQPRELTKEDLTARRNQFVAEIAQVHPGFQTASSVVIHHFGMDDKYDNWKSGLLSSNDHFGLQFDEPRFAHQAAMMEPPPGSVLDQPAVLVSPPDVAEAVEGVPVASEIIPVPNRPKASNNLVEGFEGRVKIEELNMQLGRNRLHQMKSRVRPVVSSGASQRGHFAIAQSQRNATALFGAGLIDSVSDKVLEDAANKKYKEFPDVSGRVARLPDGKIGRFGWKSQKATLREFTVTACAVELGLHVPEHPQSGDPNNAKYQPAGFDLTKKECDSLVEYLRDLPAPKMRDSVHPAEKAFLAEGKNLFASVGCAACHTENLGEAPGIFSDLLVHDMGEEMGDTGSYGVFLPNSPGGDDGSPVPPITELTQPLNQQRGVFTKLAATTEEPQKITGATRLEWRTPPLWGVRDSAPYLHDGRADTLEEAVAMHGGESMKSATLFFALKPEEQRKIVFFLKSLEAPTEGLANR